MRNRYQSIPDRSRPGLPTTAQVSHSRAPVEIMLQLNKVKIRAEKEEESECRSSEKRERKTLTHKGGYFKYWNDDWNGKRAGRYDGAKECRHIVSTGNKVER